MMGDKGREREKLRMDGKKNVRTPPSQKRTERRNYPMEVNEVSQVDEGKIATKRGQRFLFSLSLFRGKWLRSRSILLEDAALQSRDGVREMAWGGEYWGWEYQD